MASINQLVSEIAHSVQGADNIPTRRGIRLAIIHARNQLIRHSYEEHGYIDRVIQQRFRVALIDVPDGDVNIAGAGIDAKDYKETVGTIKRTLNKVPRPTRLTNNLPFSAVKTTGVKNPISIPFVREASSQVYSNLPGFCPNVTYDYINDYIYINTINADALKDISSIVIEAPFEKPEIVEMETSTDGTYTIDDDNEYFLPEDMIDNVKKLVLNTFNVNVVRDDDKIPTPNLVK